MLSSHEHREWSQHGEDGVLLWLSERTPHKFIVEIGCGNGVVCNSANLIKNHGWRGRLVDRQSSNIDVVRLKYTPFKAEGVACIVSAENINFMVGENVGILSIDVDGNDYWLWKGVETSPDIVVIEYNANYGLKPVTMPYNPTWQWGDEFSRLHYGASLEALTKLAHEKGYQLVGCEASGTNAFYIRKELGEGLPDLTAEQAYLPAKKQVNGQTDYTKLVVV